MKQKRVIKQFEISGPFFHGDMFAQNMGIIRINYLLNRQTIRRTFDFKVSLTMLDKDSKSLVFMVWNRFKTKFNIYR